MSKSFFRGRMAGEEHCELLRTKIATLERTLSIQKKAWADDELCEASAAEELYVRGDG